MKRFTNRYSNGKAFIMNCTLQTTNGIEDVIEKLAYYEDLEEDGRLIRLPCKVGDKVWIIYHNFIYESSVSGFFIEKNQVVVEFNCIRPITATYATNFGKTIFLSYEEAEGSLVKS